MPLSLNLIISVNTYMNDETKNEFGSGDVLDGSEVFNIKRMNQSHWSRRTWGFLVVTRRAITDLALVHARRHKKRCWWKDKSTEHCLSVRSTSDRNQRLLRRKKAAALEYTG